MSETVPYSGTQNWSLVSEKDDKNLSLRRNCNIFVDEKIKSKFTPQRHHLSEIVGLKQ